MGTDLTRWRNDFTRWRSGRWRNDSRRKDRKSMITPTHQNAQFDLVCLQQKRDNGFPSFWITFKFFAIVSMFAYGPYCHLVESKQGE